MGASVGLGIGGGLVGTQMMAKEGAVTDISDKTNN
jgi:hypothetical protein